MYLVTGGAGFIGSTIAKKLIDSGEEVRIVDNLSTGNLSKLNGYLSKIDFIEADINDTGYSISKLFQGVHTVIHQAAISSVERSVKNPAETEKNNVLGTVNLLMQCVSFGVKRVVSAGSAAVYGDPVANEDNNNSPKSEAVIFKAIGEETRISPLSPYAFSKYALEYYSKSFSELYNLETVVLRYFNVFGPNQDPCSDYSGVISKFTELMLKGQTPIINGDGQQTRDFVYVEDVAAANILAATSEKVGAGEVINIGRGKAISINELVSVINKLINIEIKPHYGPARQGDVRHSLANIQKARNLLGYEPRTSFQKGLGLTLSWLRK